MACPRIGVKEQRTGGPTNSGVMKVLHVIESLEFGGAEKVVVDLANALVERVPVGICCVKRIGELYV